MGDKKEEEALQRKTFDETLVLLSRKKPDGHINITVEFGEEGHVSLKEVDKCVEARKQKEKAT